MTETKPPAHNLYSGYLQGTNTLAPQLWGNIPSTMGEAAKLLPKIRETYGEPPETLIQLQKAMKKSMHKMGILTEKTSKNIDKMQNGVIEAGQQPNCLGGPSLILNKIAYATNLAKQAKIVPLYYVADYDGVQPELTNTRLPSPSQKGIMINYPTQPEHENTSIYALENPPEQWLTKTLEKIKSNYRGLTKGTPSQERLLQNLHHIYTIIKQAYYTTTNVSTFSTKLIGTILNHEANMATPTYWHSMPETRHLFQQGYETLLAEPNRTKFIETTNKAAETIESAGYKSQIGLRDNDYVPFYIECNDCNKTRVELKYTRNPASPTATAKGKCPKCGSTHEYSFNAQNPDLTDIANDINPRVDSRQVIVDSVIPILAHIGGPGETSYYAEVIPAAKALDLPFPVFLRYSRTFYNTPWNTVAAEKLQTNGYTPLTNKTLFNEIGNWVESRNKQDPHKLAMAHNAIQESIESSYHGLLHQTDEIQTEIKSIKQKLREPGDRKILIQDMREKQKTAQEIETYLSWAYGRFSPEKYGQEVSWNWIDLATVTGLNDLMKVYERIYNSHTPNSSMFYVNLS